ncbi:hypothetical protein G6O69_25805 [Pseudenhygromyxa sp. WMMC2535]|uniref:hypothetical protein n=1 Tax=Pseudenhygromyxa sp. WMMC2535 TaxID=2712867 RepID=UPI00155503C0|nr:hypothetical protein [Pseudenhygromyxa sp. WMMC2535]NVB41281.1 hypothetical protein [Pseudenhygromyxa sp. WMMC2535]
MAQHTTSRASLECDSGHFSRRGDRLLTLLPYLNLGLLLSLLVLGVLERGPSLARELSTPKPPQVLAKAASGLLAAEEKSAQVAAGTERSEPAPAPSAPLEPPGTPPAPSGQSWILGYGL